MHNHRPDDFYDPWDEDGPLEGKHDRKNPRGRPHLIAALMKGLRGILRSLSMGQFRPPR